MKNILLSVFSGILFLCGFFVSPKVWGAEANTNPPIIFYTDFSGTTASSVTANVATCNIMPENEYVNIANPSSSQFTCISAGGNSSSGRIDISSSGFVTTAGSNSNFRFAATRNANLLQVAPKAVKVEFTALISIGGSSSSPKFFFQVGNGFSNESATSPAIPSKPADAIVHSGFGVRYQSSSNIHLYQNNGTSVIHNSGIDPRATAYGNKVWTMVINNTGDILSYTAPDGSTETLANDCFDLWIHQTKFGNDIPATTSTQEINQFRFGEYSTNGRANWRITNLSISDISPVQTQTSKYFRSINDGVFSDASHWEFSSDYGISWVDAPTGIPQETLVDSVIISSGNAIRVEEGNYMIQNLVVEPEAKLYTATGTVQVTDAIALHDEDEYVAGQIINTDFGAPALSDLTTDSIVKVHKYFNKGIWYQISLPFEVDKITDTDGNELTGSVNGNTANYYLKYFDGQQRAISRQSNIGASGTNWKYLADGYPYSNMQANTGYIFAVGTSREVIFTSKPNATTTGNPADIAKVEEKVLSATPFNSDDINHAGWNLIGNPYSSVFNLNMISPKHVCYVFNPANNNYETYLETNYYIDPFKAFFVQASDNLLTCQTDGVGLRNLNLEPVLLEVVLQLSDSSYTDNFRIHLREDATVGYDLNKDGQKIFDTNTKVPQLYSLQNGINLAINALPLNYNETILVPLAYFSTKANTYTISLSPNNQLENITKIILRDKIANIETDLLSSSYTFSSTKKEIVTNRFEIEIGTSENNIHTSITTSTVTNIEIKTIGKQIILHGLESSAEVSLYDLTGRKIILYQNINNNQPIDSHLWGTYIVKVRNKTQTAVAKIVLR